MCVCVYKTFSVTVLVQYLTTCYKNVTEKYKVFQFYAQIFDNVLGLFDLPMMCLNKLLSNEDCMSVDCNELCICK